MQATLPKLAVVRQKAASCTNFLTSSRFIVAVAMLINAVFLIYGIRGDTPVTVEGDEFCYVPSAVYMAATNSWNPRWFINPGSTVFYPLTVYYHILNAVVFHGSLFSEFKSNDDVVFGQMYLVCLVPRYFSVAYTVFSLPLLYLFAKKIFDRNVALIAVVFMAFSPIFIYYGQVIRTDAPALFFGLLAMYWCTKVYDAPTVKNQLVTGIAIGLAVSSRYFMLALAPVLFLINCISLNTAPREKRLKTIVATVVGMVSTVVSFLATTPYFLADFKTVMSDMKFESQSVMVGCDNLGTLGNLNFYLTDALPCVLTISMYFLAVVGIGMVLWNRQPKQVVWLVFIAVVLVGSSINTRHWDRWMMPILPVMMILAGYALNRLVTVAVSSMRLHPKAGTVLNVFVTCVVVVFMLRQPLNEIIEQNLMKGTYSTEAQIYGWIKKNIKEGTKIALDGGWPWGFRERYQILENLWRPDYLNRDYTWSTPQKLADAGYKYLIIMEWFGVRYIADPIRFPHEANFYKELKKYPVAYEMRKADLGEVGGKVIKQRGSPIIIYDLQPANVKEQAVQSNP